MDTTYSYTNLDITFHTSAIALFKKKFLRILQNQGQAAYLIAGLQEKITYRSAFFPSGSNEARDALQNKVIREIMSKVVREMAS